jgi:acyl-coenzyme A synthetase/AMP-(fatty) acid ligase/acyl carrier protein
MSASNPLGIDANWRRSTLPMPDSARLAMTLCECLLEAAARHADRIAIVSDAERVTFVELVGQVGALTEAIRACRTPDGPVALLLPSGVSYIAAWFACVAAGRPMLMVELANPPARNAALLDAAGATLVLHDGDQAAVEATGTRAHLLVAPSLPPRALKQTGLGVDQPAFLFATSGTSGRPKLVVYSQRTVQAKVQCSIVMFGTGHCETVMVVGSHSNFGVLHHALVFLFQGGTVCLHDMRDGGLSGMFRAITRFGVEHMRFTPSLFRVVVTMPEAAAALRQLKGIRFAAEPLLRSDIDLARAHLSPGCVVQNLYGSTESMMFFWSDQTETLPSDGIVPNGRIYPVAEFLLLDEDSLPAGESEAGELVISSPNHALGDWVDGRVDPTRFPDDPRGDGRRLYYTGDVAGLLPDGTMLVLGRKDRLLKINGQRVSPLEIEATLRTMPGCSQVAVLPRRQGAVTSLVAFLVVDRTKALPDNPGAWLGRRLPRVMVPGRFEYMAELPLLPGGKVDAGALLATLSDPQAANRPEHSSEMVGFLTATWAEILRVLPPKPDADFFALGGDSLKLLELAMAVERRTGRQVSADAFLKTPTIERLAGLLESGADLSPPRATAPDAARAARFDAGGKVVLRRLREARGASRGIVLGMPGLLGHAVPISNIAAHALHDYDVWAFTAELDERTMLDDEVWYDCAQEIAEQLTSETWLRPLALLGFSVGGYIGWLVDRMMSGANWRPRRIINVDAGPVHTKQAEWCERIDALTPGDHCVEPAQMLLLHRRRPTPFSLVNDNHARWSKLDIALQTIGFRTLDHMDMRLPQMVAAASDAMATFVETGRIAPRKPDQDAIFDTLGGRLYDMLGNPSARDPAAVRALIDGQALPNDGTCRLALLFLAIAVLDYRPAMDFACRMTEAQPQHRAATYAQVALLSLGGDREAAAMLAEAWCCTHPADRAMRARAARDWQSPEPWDRMTDVVIGSDISLDRAIDIMAACPRRAPNGPSPTRIPDAAHRPARRA